MDLVEHVARGEPAEKLRAQVARRHPEATLDQVDDAFQEACLLAVRLARGRSEGEVFTWIRTTTTRKVSEMVASSRRERPVDILALDGLCAGDAEGPADELIGREDEADLEMLMASVLGRLSERQRDVVALHAHGRNRPQIAEHLGITRRTVKRELERILSVGRTELARFAGGGCAEGEQLVRRLAFGLAASPQERGGARLHLATCTRCATFHERLEVWHQKAAAMVPLPAAEAASPGVAERALHGASDIVAGLKQQLVDGGAQLKQHAASAYYRAVDPTPFSAMRPGAAATAVAGCLALGGGATYCAQQGVDPFGELRGVVMPAPERETPQAEPPAATPPVSEPTPSPPPGPAPTPEPAAPAPAPPQAPPAQPTPAPSEAGPVPGGARARVRLRARPAVGAPRAERRADARGRRVPVTTPRPDQAVPTPVAKRTGVARMTPPRPQQSRRLGALAAAVALAAASPAVTSPEPALAGTFTVAACDAAGGPSGSWTPQAGSVDAFKICPSSNLPGFGGMGTRLAGRTFASGEFSRLWFFAPAGTTISGLTWAGAYTHNCDVRWANQLRAQGTADVNLFGTTGAFAFCPATGEYPPTWLAAPPGTTRLLQNTQCSQASCASGAAFRTRSAAVVIDDPTPPSLAITGGGLSGSQGWVRGPQALTASAGDVTGIRLVRMQIAGYPGMVDSAKPCDYSMTAPCAAGNGDTALGVRTTEELADGPHAVTVTAYDAAGNVASRETVARVDNNAPAPPAAALEGGSGWRASNAYTLRWAPPEAPSPSRAPVTAARYQVCPAGSTVGCAPTRTVSEPSPTDVSPKAPGEGEFEVRVALVDAAGNGAGADARWSEPVLMRYDPDAAHLRAWVVTSSVRRRRVTVRGRRRVVRRRVVRLAPSRRVRYGRRFEVAGQLTSRSGQPRVNTTVEVYGRSDSLGGPESLLGSIRTDTGGRFRYRAEARQSHTLRFVRRASAATVRVRVPARLSFAARPRSVINGEAMTLRGRVLGAIPTGGKQVVVQAYSRGRWRTFQLLRTDAQGRYRHVYRFDGTRGRAVYPLRAVTTREATFAHEPGRSKVRRVTVRGL